MFLADVICNLCGTAFANAKFRDGAVIAQDVCTECGGRLYLDDNNEEDFDIQQSAWDQPLDGDDE